MTLPTKRHLDFSLFVTITLLWAIAARSQTPSDAVRRLPNGLGLGEVPGNPQLLNTLPTVIAVSPNGRYLALLNNGYGSYSSELKQSIAVFTISTGTLADYPDDRLGKQAAQTYFHGLAFSSDGTRLYASVGSTTDPLGETPGHTGNSIFVYDFADGKVAPREVLRVPPPDRRNRQVAAKLRQVTFPAGLSVVRGDAGDRLLVACNVSDEALWMEATGKVLKRFDLSRYDRVPAAYPIGTAATRDGRIGYVSLWNASRVAELDLVQGTIRRWIPLLPPSARTAPGSHPSALLLSPDERYLFITLTSRDRVALYDRRLGRVVRWLTTKLPGQKFGGSDPDSIAYSEKTHRLYVTNSASDSVAVFDLSGSQPATAGSTTQAPAGFIPTEWYPTAVATAADQLFVAAGKGTGSGPNSSPLPDEPPRKKTYPYIPSMTRGSLARTPESDFEPEALSKFTEHVLESNRARGNGGPIPFATGKNPIRHVIYIIKENRTYDQVLGDLGVGNSDPSIVLYGEDITPNQHELARQFGVLDNFFVSGDVSGGGHQWSTAATSTDYTEKTWPVAYRGKERTYDYEGVVFNRYPLADEHPDVAEPATGYLWTNFARHGITYRHYGEFVSTEWCTTQEDWVSPKQGTPHPRTAPCERKTIRPGEPLPTNVGTPHGSASPYPWAIPLPGRNIPTKPELRGHFDPLFPDFETSYPDQLRADEFLNEFNGFVEARKAGHESMPQFILLRLPNDHTGGVKKGLPTPSACVADNDLAVGRVADAVSHSPYWEDTAIFILEDDAQDGPDHVDGHRSIAFVISKYSPRKLQDGSVSPFVDNTFYTTLNMLRTIEGLLSTPPMNNNDARAAFMSALFAGAGDQPAFNANFQNLKNGLIYKISPSDAPEQSLLDFSHPDSADAAVLNRVLWRDRKGDIPMPPPANNRFPQ